MNFKGPPSQGSKYQPGAAPPVKTPGYSLAYSPPRGPALDQRPYAETEWGHQTGLGYSTERLAVQMPADGLKPDMKAALCAVSGFLLYSIFMR
jgi:hypothetical protein